MSDDHDAKSDEKPKSVIFRREQNLQPQKSFQKGADCSLAKICGTCRYINEPYEPNLANKWQAGVQLMAEAGLLRHAQTVEPETARKTFAYRNHAKLSVRPRAQAAYAPEGSRFAFGLYRPGSHDLVDITDCPLHNESINRFLKVLKVRLEESSLTAFDEATLTGDLRYVTVRSCHHTDEIMVTYVVGHDGVKEALKAITTQIRDAGHHIQSAHINVNGEAGNVIFGDTSTHLLGTDRLREGVVDLTFEIGPTSFFQVNPWEAERIYRRVEQLSGMNGRSQVAWDLYCGIGQMAMVLARAGFRVLGMEVNPQATRDAQKNAHRNLEGNHPTFITGRVENELGLIPGWAKKPKIIITNPARKGLDPQVRKFLRDTLREDSDCQLLYVSCEITSLVRDVADLVADGDLKLRQLEAFDMFPFTEKMEWLAVIR